LREKKKQICKLILIIKCFACFFTVQRLTDAHLAPLMELQYERWYREETNITPKEGRGHQLYKELRTQNQLWEVQQIYGPQHMATEDDYLTMMYGTWFDMKKRLMYSVYHVMRMGYDRPREYGHVRDIASYVIHSKKGGFDAYTDLSWGYDHWPSGWNGGLLTDRYSGMDQRWLRVHRGTVYH